VGICQHRQNPEHYLVLGEFLRLAVEVTQQLHLTK
jgi:hypothetical protein